MVLRGQPPPGILAGSLGVLTWLLLISWVPQSGYYLFRSGQRLLCYRKRLRDVFANTESRDMDWLVVLLCVLGVIWLLVVAATISSNVFNHPLAGHGYLTLTAFAVVWMLAVWGLQQKPGFEGHYLQTNTPDSLVERTETPTPAKYSRSALDKEHSGRIANKIEVAMASGKLYLRSDLTLGDLAQAVGVAPNYVSQTLNETVGETFFDYVNRKRVEAAQILLLESDRSALVIAHEVGFNARSTFYKAFRRLTGSSPGEYRKSNL